MTTKTQLIDWKAEVLTAMEDYAYAYWGEHDDADELQQARNRMYALVDRVMQLDEPVDNDVPTYFERMR